jgi:eukaryotic-like serine/threonine-protein kinase
VPPDPFGLVGQVLDGQYRVERYVGEGGFSAVYKATLIGLSEPIAVKCLKLPSGLGSALVESFVARFRDESRLHYRLSQGNLNIVRSISSGMTSSPSTSALVPYIVLEWLEGWSLAHELAERNTRGMKGRRLPEVVALLDSAVEAIAYAHAQGVVHRDLNPGNLFFAKTTTGRKLKVLDFGVAKILSDSALAMQSVRTVGNVQMFAPAYGAPEQFDRRLGDIGPWTDVYAIALLVVELLTDRSAIEGAHVGEFAAQALDPSRRPTPRALGADVGDEVEKVLARAVSVAPGDRTRDAGELWGMLKHAMHVDAAAGPPPRKGSVPVDKALGGTVRMDSAAHRAASGGSVAAMASPAARAVRWTPSSGVEPLSAMPSTPPSIPPPISVSPPPIAAPSFAPPPATPISNTPTTATLPPRPIARRPLVAIVVVALLVASALVGGARLLWSREQEGQRIPSTEQSR